MIPHPAQGFPVVLSAPSGAGKTTIARRLVTEHARFVFSISVTTRSPRKRERHGKDYLFVGGPEFGRMIEEGELAEWAEVHGQLYGTPRKNLEEAAARGEYTILDIDVQGARQIRQAVPSARLIFILPPSAEVLMSRLTGRGTEDRAQVTRRLLTARTELKAVDEFDLVVVNDDLDRAVEAVRGFVEDGIEPSSPGGDPVAEASALREAIDRILRDDYDVAIEDRS